MDIASSRPAGASERSSHEMTAQTDEHQRTQVYELNEIAALEGLTMKWESRVRLDVVRQNLMRMWSTT